LALPLRVEATGILAFLAKKGLSGNEFGSFLVKSGFLSRKGRLLLIIGTKQRQRESTYGKTKLFSVIILILFCFSLAGCFFGKSNPPSLSSFKREGRHLRSIGFSIQTGAFRNASNAAMMTENLRKNGVEATYFLAQDGLFKVRFGSFKTKELAINRAQHLVKAGVINDFYIVSPSEFSISRLGSKGEESLRQELVKTARSFVGVPYLWGGDNPESGFDCSGLTMTIYQLNGLDMPRTAKEQYFASREKALNEIRQGDLIFYHTDRRRAPPVTHVGIYIGDGKFIHAPGRGKNVCYESVERAFYKKRFVGVGSFL